MSRKTKFNVSEEEMTATIQKLTEQNNRKPKIREIAEFYNTSYYSIQDAFTQKYPHLKDRLFINHQKPHIKITLTKEQIREKLFEYKEKYGYFPTYKEFGEYINVNPPIIRLHIIKYDLNDYITNGLSKPKKYNFEYVYNYIVKYIEEKGEKPTVLQLANYMGKRRESIYAALIKLELTHMMNINTEKQLIIEKEKHPEWDKLPLRKGPITRQRILEKLNEIRRINGLEELKE